MTSSRTRVCLICFLLALCVRLTLLFGLNRYEIGRPETVRIAISVARTGNFADPYIIPTGPTAHCAPLYPALIAPFYAVLGDNLAADRARFVFNAVAAASEYALLPLVAEALGLGWGPGVLASMTGALIPLHYWPECISEFEHSWTAVFLETAVLLFARFLKRPSFNLLSGARTGLLWGAGLLLAPTVAPVLAGFVAIGACKLRPSLRTALRWSSVLAATGIAVLAPWLVRNSIRLGGLCFVRDNLGLELFVSNQDGASSVAEENYVKPYWTTAHPHASVAAAMELRRMGELPFERQKLHQALDWIESHPWRFVSLTTRRTFRFWFPAVPRYTWAFWTVTILAGIGWLLLLAHARQAAIVLGVVLAGYSAFFSLIQNTLRYQHPIWWVLVLLASWTVYTPAGKFGRQFILRLQAGKRRPTPVACACDTPNCPDGRQLV